MTEEPILRFKKPTIVWRGILFIFAYPWMMFALNFVAIVLLAQGRYSFILPVIFMIGFAYFFWDSFVHDIRMQYAATFTLYPHRAVMEFKRRPTISIDLDPSIRVNISYDLFMKGPYSKRVTAYIFRKDKDRQIEIDSHWGWRRDDILRMWNPFLEVIELNGLRLNWTLGTVRELGGMVPDVGS